MGHRYADRRSRLVRRMSDTDVDAVVLSSGPNARYFTGFSGEHDRQLLVVLIPDADPVAITPDQYVGQVRDYADVTAVEAVPTTPRRPS